MHESRTIELPNPYLLPIQSIILFFLNPQCCWGQKIIQNMRTSMKRGAQPCFGRNHFVLSYRIFTFSNIEELKLKKDTKNS